MHGRRLRDMWPLPLPCPPKIAADSAGDRPGASAAPDLLLKDGRRIRVGDCALFQAGNSPPFIGIVRSFTSDKEDFHKICVNWLYRPADVKLAKGIVFEATPNEVFYSFHKDVVPAASLLHPCKVAFLRKGVELPTGISSYVCRRVYDIANKCLWWLTDQDYINERQEEVDKLLDKTQLEMHAGQQSGGRSPKQQNGVANTPQLKNGPESAQNGGTSFPTQTKGKKRDRNDQGTEATKRERSTKLEDGDSAIKSESMIKEEISKITEKGRLVSPEAVERLVSFLQLDRTDRKIDVSGRIQVAAVIAATDREDCLSKFVQLKGVSILDDWLQEAHKGKTRDGSSPKEGDNRAAAELLLPLLRALEKLPVDLNALQTCQIGKSVNHLRSHKNPDIHKKARSLVDTWKRRVDLEMSKINDAKSVGSTQPVHFPVKSSFSDGSGNKRTGPFEVPAENPAGYPSSTKNPSGKTGQHDSMLKSSPLISGSLKTAANMPATAICKDKAAAVGGPEAQSAAKDEKSCSSSQSQNNSQSCSSDHAKTTGSSWKEDARSSTAGSKTATKRHSSSSHHRRSSNALLGASSGVQKESNLDHANGHRLIVRLPNPGRSPARSFSGGSFEDPSATGSRASSPGVPDKHEHADRRMKLRSDAHRSNIVADTNMEPWQSNEVKEDAVAVRSTTVIFDENSRTAEDTGKAGDASKVACSPYGNDKRVFSSEARPRNSFSSMHALIESCAKYSEASPSLPAGDDIGMNLLASVATGEISSNGSPRASPASEDLCEGKNEEKSRLSCDNDAVQSHHIQSDEGGDADSRNHGKNVGSMSTKEESCKEDNNSSAMIKTAVSGNNNNLVVKKTEQSPISVTSPGTAETFCPKSELQLEEDQNRSPPASKLLELKESDNVMDKRMSGQTVPDDSKPFESSTISTSVVACKSVAGEQDIVGTASRVKPEKLGAEESSLSDPKEFKGNPSASIRQVSAERNGDDAVVVKTDESRTCNSDGPEVRQSDGGNLEKQDLDSLATHASEYPANVSVGNTGIIADSKIKDESGPVGSASEELPSSSVSQESELRIKSTGKVPEDNTLKNDKLASSVVTPEPDGAVLDFDLNEGIPGDDNNQGELAVSTAAICSSAANMSSLSSFSNTVSNGSHAPVTVAAPAKGPFVPPENLLKGKSELGWRGSAATSAFRPAEPRKVLEMPLNMPDAPSSESVVKQCRPPLDIDLNVPDERILEDISPRNITSDSRVVSNTDASSRNGGLDLDLNITDEGAENGQFITSSTRMSEVSIMPVRATSGGFPDGEANILRDFDLNNGPSVEDGSLEHGSRSQQLRSANMPFISPVPGFRLNNVEIGSASTWFPPGNSYPAVAIPSFLPDRGEQPYPILAAPGAPRIFGPVTGGGFGTDTYRGPVLSSSPAMTFPQATQFPYASLPFASGFPLPSSSFSGGSTTFVDSLPGGASGFPGMPSQLLGPVGAVSSRIPRPPYVMSLPEGASAGSDNSRKWGRQAGLDLNAGPGNADTEGKDERLPSASRQAVVANPQAYMEEQARILGGLKRKEPDGGWDADRSVYRQLQWQ